MNVDISKLEQFTEKLEKLNDIQKDEFMKACCKELAARLLALVIKKTPVGVKSAVKGPKVAKVKGASGKTMSMLTKEGARYEQYWKSYHGGTLRRGWTAGTNQSASVYAKNLEIQHTGSGFRVEITNPVEYASYVEYGHRQTPGRYVPALGVRLKQGWVPGKFMLTISEEQIRNAAPGILQRKLKSFMKDVFEE